MNWTRKYSVLAGVGLIVITNVTIVLGVGYNRNGAPDSVLTLSQRELQVPYNWGVNKDNSGISLKLNWRMPGSINQYNTNPESTSNWLNEKKLESLGFDIKPISTELGESDFKKQLSKEVFLVLEFNGTAYKNAIEHAKNIEPEEIEKKRKETSLDLELNSASRLFVVDAGVDREQLRAMYPDNKLYSIVRGQIRINGNRNQKTLSGFISNISAETINVPVEFRNFIEPIRRQFDLQNPYPNINSNSFEATIAFGKRLEPWIVNLSKK